MLHSLKKIFIDSPIAGIRRAFFWLVYHSVISCPKFFFKPYYYLRIFPSLKVGKDGRVELYMLLSKIVYGCCMRCEFCSAFSPFMKGYVPADELLQSYALWSKKMKPKYFYFTGGEPLLHPELATILRESAKIWGASTLKIQTNGMQIDRLKSDVVQALKETDCELIVSEHSFASQHRERLDAGYARLKKEGVRFIVRPSRLTWVEMYRHDAEGTMIPYESDPQKTWNRCAAARVSINIKGDKIFKCGPLLHIHDAVEKGVLDAERWKTAMTYQPPTLQSTAEEIVAHLRTGSIPECTVCREKDVIVLARQVPFKKKNAIS